MTARGVTEAYEVRLWEGLNVLLAEAVPDAASEAEAENAITAAVAGADAEIADRREESFRTLAEAKALSSQPRCRSHQLALLGRLHSSSRIEPPGRFDHLCLQSHSSGR